MNRFFLCIFSVFCVYVNVSAKSIVEKDFSTIFGKYLGTIVVFDNQKDQYFVHNKQRSEERFTPASTFKIPNSIIALESKIIKSVDETYSWDTLKYPVQDWWFPQWKQQHTMRSAIKFSVVPFYRNIASQIGPERMKKYLEQFSYGNQDISSGIDTFWLNGSLQISAIEQIDFLNKFYFNKLGVSTKAIIQVKDILIQEKNEQFILSAKTGGVTLSKSPEKALGWYVGYVEKGKDVFFFALNIEGENFNDILAPRSVIAKNVLKSLGIID